MAREGIPYLIITGFVAVFLFTLSSASGYSIPGYLGGAFAAGFVLVCVFFRDPERQIPTEQGAVVSAADGKVVSIRKISGDEEWGLNGIQVSVFLSIFDVHINRIPYSGRVVEVNRKRGRFLAAFVERASVENEQVVIEIENAGRTMVVKQIAGFIARRIVCRATKGVRVKKGERFGLIKFGSRVDLILPPESEIRVQVGDKTTGGETIIGVIKT